MLHMFQRCSHEADDTTEASGWKPYNSNKKESSGNCSSISGLSPRMDWRMMYFIIHIPTALKSLQADFRHGFSIEVQEYAPDGQALCVIRYRVAI